MTNVVGQVVEVEPIELVALAGLGVVRLSRPADGDEEDVEAGLAVGVGVVA
ncbi:hypothetical protein [Nonomuraea angiospora]